MVYNTINKLKWTNKLGRCKIIFVHRGATNNIKTISGDQITEVRKTYFCYKSNGKETFIPYHRVKMIKIDGRVIWKRLRRSG
ncbi:MAG TPA: DUF504 domain-containing protein [Candidatus Aenigmarchaeota archaeon]|nr:MAG: DUF504 domain-containing protein [Candidatus Aenigmarchaeota archaeon]HDD46389.1 DUF504 domain-containing protein [Candidatus Aenigmarchaeota archaeon]